MNNKRIQKKSLWRYRKRFCKGGKKDSRRTAIPIKAYKDILFLFPFVKVQFFILSLTFTFIQ